VSAKLCLALAPVLVAAITLAAAPASAEERSCRGSLGAVTVDNLRVPQGATCRLRGTRVQGTLQVQRGATLNAARLRVIGNIQAEGAANVNVASSRIGGSVQVVQGRNSRFVGNFVNHDVQYFENRGVVSVSRNRIDGNLQCKENRRRPVGGGNRVQGVKEDQCAHLSNRAREKSSPCFGQMRRASSSAALGRNRVAGRDDRVCGARPPLPVRPCAPIPLERSRHDERRGLG
jgi:hypothetical protein